MIRSINVRIIPMSQMTIKNGAKVTTCGTWWEDGDVLEVRLAQMCDWRYEVAVLFHELIEFFWCQRRGIKTQPCDDFDEWFERQYELGKYPKTAESGFHKDCPYRGGHVWGSRFERVVTFILACSWKKYCAECNHVMGIQ